MIKLRSPTPGQTDITYEEPRTGPDGCERGNTFCSILVVKCPDSNCTAAHCFGKTASFNCSTYCFAFSDFFGYIDVIFAELCYCQVLWLERMFGLPRLS